MSIAVIIKGEEVVRVGAGNTVWLIKHRAGSYLVVKMPSKTIAFYDNWKRKVMLRTVFAVLRVVSEDEYPGVTMVEIEARIEPGKRWKLWQQNMKHAVDAAASGDTNGMRILAESLLTAGIPSGTLLGSPLSKE